MRISERIKNNLPVISSYILLLILICAETVFASSEGGETGGWALTDTYRVMNFAVLAVALFFLLRKPAAQFLGDRIQGISDQLKELEEKKLEAEKKLSEYNDRLSTLSKESEKIITQYKDQGKALRDKILKEAEAAAVKLEEQAMRNIDYEFKQARQQLEQEVFIKAIAKAEEKLKANITDQDQEKLVDEYLTKVVIK